MTLRDGFDSLGKEWMNLPTILMIALSCFQDWKWSSLPQNGSVVVTILTPMSYSDRTLS